MKLGEHWKSLSPYFHRFDGVIAVLIVAGAGALLYNRLRGAAFARGTGAAQ
jgi:hypothetical protein